MAQAQFRVVRPEEEIEEEELRRGLLPAGLLCGSSDSEGSASEVGGEDTAIVPPLRLRALRPEGGVTPAAPQSGHVRATQVTVSSSERIHGRGVAPNRPSSSLAGRGRPLVAPPGVGLQRKEGGKAAEGAAFSRHPGPDHDTSTPSEDRAGDATRKTVRQEWGAGGPGGESTRRSVGGQGTYRRKVPSCTHDGTYGRCQCGHSPRGPLHHYLWWAHHHHRCRRPWYGWRRPRK